MNTLSNPAMAALLLFTLSASTKAQTTAAAAASPATSPIAARVDKKTLQHEPTNAAEATSQNKYLGKLTPEEYAAWDTYVKSRPADEQQWLRNLERLLGFFYAPPYMKALPAGKAKPDNDCWAYVKDDPALPRVLIIGDSISRSYTVPARAALAGKANVHRAPANCGTSDNFFKDGETWLLQCGSNRWDLIVFNFGIHDRAKPPAAYAANLKKIYGRLKQTGATLLWVDTTPFAEKEDPAGTDRSTALNATGNAIAKEEGVDVIKLHDLMLPELATLQNPADRTHFNEIGQRKMGEAVSAAVAGHLKPAPASYPAPAAP